MSIDRFDGKKDYTFDNLVVFDKYEELREQPEAYVVLDYSDDSVYIRELTTNDTAFLKFSDKKNMSQFIDEKTLGKDTYVPVFSVGSSMDRSSMSISYFEEHKSETKENINKNCIYFYIMYVVWIAIISVGVTIYEKKN